LAIQTAQAAPLAATVELVRARPEHPNLHCRDRRLDKPSLANFHFLPYRTGDCWIEKARLSGLFSTLQNTNCPKEIG